MSPLSLCLLVLFCTPLSLKALESPIWPALFLVPSFPWSISLELDGGDFLPGVACQAHLCLCLCFSLACRSFYARGGVPGSRLNGPGRGTGCAKPKEVGSKGSGRYLHSFKADRCVGSRLFRHLSLLNSGASGKGPWWGEYACHGWYKKQKPVQAAREG